MLKGKLIQLGPLKRKYIDKYLEWLNNPELTQYLTIYKPITRDMEEEWFESQKNQFYKIIFSILIPKDQNQNTLIGNCGIEIQWKDRVGTCGIFIGEPKYRGKGYGADAMKLLIEYAFKTLNLNRVQLECFKFNTRALNLYNKLGFLEEGCKRKAIYENGSYSDIIILGLLREEWNE